MARVRKQFVLRMTGVWSAINLLQKPSIGRSRKVMGRPRTHLHRQRVWSTTLLSQSLCVVGKCSGTRIRDPQSGKRGTTCAMDLSTIPISPNIGSSWGANSHGDSNLMSSTMRSQRSLSPLLSGSMLSWMLRTDARAIPIEIACSSLPGIILPSNRQSKKRSARI